MLMRYGRGTAVSRVSPAYAGMPSTDSAEISLLRRQLKCAAPGTLSALEEWLRGLHADVMLKSFEISFRHP